MFFAVAETTSSIFPLVHMFVSRSKNSNKIKQELKHKQVSTSLFVLAVDGLAELSSKQWVTDNQNRCIPFKAHVWGTAVDQSGQLTLCLQMLSSLHTLPNGWL